MAGIESDLYLGTASGVFRAEARAGGPYHLAPLGPQGADVSAIAVDAADARRIYAATRNEGLWISPDGGASWREHNRGILYKELWSVAQHPSTGDLYVGSGPPAVFKSTDRGETFSHCRSLHDLEDSLHWTFPRAPHFAHVKSLELSPSDPMLVLGAIEEGWVVRSTDGGGTWETCKQGVAFDAHAVTLLPGEPRVLLVTSGAGVFRSENGGDTFSRSDAGIAGGYMSPAAVHPAQPAVVYAAAAELPPPFWPTRAQGASTRFYRSDDGGRSWGELARQGLPEVVRAGARSCAIDPERPDTVYFGMSDGSVWLTDDAGASFRRVVEGLPGWITAVRPIEAT